MILDLLANLLSKLEFWKNLISSSLVDKVIESDKMLEQASILLSKGSLAFWHYIEDTIAGIIQSSFDRIRELVFYVYMDKGPKWMAGFFILAVISWTL